MDSHENHEAAVQAIKDEIGLDAAEERADDLFNQRCDIHERIMALRATTIEGLRAKAEVVVQICWGGSIRNDFDPADLMLVSIVRDLTGAPDEAAA